MRIHEDRAVRNENKAASNWGWLLFDSFFVAREDPGSIFFPLAVNAAVVFSANFPRSTSFVNKISWSVIFAGLGCRSLYRTSVFLWVECLLFRTSLLSARACSLACTARNSAAGYTREFHSDTYEAPFSTRSELWWSIFRFPFPSAWPPSTFICAHAVVSEPRKSTTKVAVPPELYRLSMEVRLVGALRQKFKARCMRRNSEENWVRAAVLQGYTYLVNAIRFGLLDTKWSSISILDVKILLLHFREWDMFHFH